MKKYSKEIRNQKLEKNEKNDPSHFLCKNKKGRKDPSSASYTWVSAGRWARLCSIPCARPRARRWPPPGAWRRPGRERSDSGPAQCRDSVKAKDKQRQEFVTPRRQLTKQKIPFRKKILLGFFFSFDTYLQEPVASPVKGGQDGRVDVTAVDALKRQNNQKTKENWEPSKLKNTRKTISNGNKQKNPKNVSRGKDKNVQRTSRRQGFFFLNWTVTFVWHCNITQSLLNFFLPFCCCCCARYEKISKTKFSRKLNEILSRMGKRDKSRPPNVFIERRKLFIFFFFPPRCCHFMHNNNNIGCLHFSLSLSWWPKKVSGAHTQFPWKLHSILLHVTQPYSQGWIVEGPFIRERQKQIQFQNIFFFF